MFDFEGSDVRALDRSGYPRFVLVDVCLDNPIKTHSAWT
jgi:hypothetical protein